MTTKIDVFPPVDTTPDDLMDHNNSSDLNLRILNTLSGSSLLCAIMEEHEDSFLVALPCKLVTYGDVRAIEQYIMFPFMRIPKPAILGIIPCFGEFEKYYVEWLLQNGNNQFPQFIGEEYITALQARFETIKGEVNKLQNSLVDIARKEEETKSTSPSIIAPPESKYKH